MKDDALNKIIKKRGEIILQSLDDAGVLSHLETHGVKVFYIGGNSMNKVKGDIDLFPVSKSDFIDKSFESIGKVKSKTQNAVTVVIDDLCIQFCLYEHSNVKSLVESFDFSHIQIGCECSLTEDSWKVTDSYVTELWQSTRALGISLFTGSDYPLSSLIRSGKYNCRGDIGGRSLFIRAVLATTTAVIERGFKDYEDFKDQLDAIDLGLVPEELGDLEREDLLKLFELLRRDK